MELLGAGEDDVSGERWDSKKAWYRWGNIVGIPLVIVLAGLGRWLYRRGQRGRVKL